MFLDGRWEGLQCWLGISGKMLLGMSRRGAGMSLFGCAREGTEEKDEPALLQKSMAGVVVALPGALAVKLPKTRNPPFGGVV